MVESVTNRVKQIHVLWVSKLGICFFQINGFLATTCLNMCFFLWRSGVFIYPLFRFKYKQHGKYHARRYLSMTFSHGYIYIYSMMEILFDGWKACPRCKQKWMCHDLSIYNLLVLLFVFPFHHFQCSIHPNFANQPMTKFQQGETLPAINGVFCPYK